MSEGTVRVRLRMSWRGNRYGDVVEMPDSDHTYQWLGLGLCEFADDDPWVEPSPVVDPVADVRWDADASRFVPLPIGNAEMAQGAPLDWPVSATMWLDRPVDPSGDEDV